MMTAAMMKADTRPARRGSNPGELWAVPSPSTLSCDGLLAWELVWMLGWVDCLSDCEVFDVGWEVEGFWTEAVLEFVLDLVVVALVVDSGFGGSDAGAEVAGGALVSWCDVF